MLGEIWSSIQNSRPLIHCITNFVSANDVANGLLAAGASPVMARHCHEVHDFARHCDALLLNLGTPDTNTGQTISLAGSIASQRNVPVVLDPVGVASSELRRILTADLLKQKIPSIIRGNRAEIATLVTEYSSAKGVDSTDTPPIETAVFCAKTLASQGPFLVISSGAIDIITDGNRQCLVRNGHEMLRRITGTGCLLSALIAACAASCQSLPFESSLTACCALGICAEKAWKQTEFHCGGTMTFRQYLIDALSLLKPDELELEARYEIS